MAHAPDGVLYTTDDSGTGDLTLTTLQAGYRSMAEAIADGDAVKGEAHYYVLKEDGAFECGTAVISGDGGSPETFTLERSGGTISSSTDGGAAIDAAGGGATQIFIGTAEAFLLRLENLKENGGDIAQTGENNDFSVGQSITGNTDITGDLDVTGDVEVTSEAAGAAAGPVLSLYRNSASPAASDVIGQFDLNGRTSTGAKVPYVRVNGEIATATNGSEDSEYVIYARDGGSLTEVLRIGYNGAAFFGLTPQGADTVNFPTAGILQNGSALAQGGLQYITKQTISGTSPLVSAVDFTSNIDDTFELYFFVLHGLTADGSDDLCLRTGNGSFASGAGDYEWEGLNMSASNSGQTSDTEIVLEGVLSGSAYNATMMVYNARSSGKTQVQWSSTEDGTGGQWTVGEYDVATAVDRFRFFLPSANFTGGEIYLYGIATS
jgi:hypothetical protein